MGRSLQQGVAEYNATGTVQRRYVFGPGIDAPIVMYDGAGTGQRRFYMRNPQGSVIGLTDTTGALLEQHSYSVFGLPDDWSEGETGNPLRYTAQRLDAETGLYYYRARYYSPALGRFLSPDPIGYGDGLNLYAYVGNDPINFSDPSGLGAEAAMQGAASVADNFAGGNEFNAALASFGSGDYVTSAIQGVSSVATAATVVATVGESAALLGSARSIGKGVVNRLRTAWRARAGATNKGGLWTATDKLTTPQNAFKHWGKHKAEFPELQNSVQYVKAAKSFLQKPPAGTLTKTRLDGDVLRFDPATNTFGVMAKDGTPRTMFRPKKGIGYWNKQ